MRAAHLSVLAAARLYGPLIVLAATSILVLRAPGGGVGFVAGLVLVLALGLHQLVFGAAEARRAFPPVFARVLLSLGVFAALAGACAPALAMAPQLIEGGLFIVTSAGLQLVLAVLIGRAPTLRESDGQ